MLMLCAALVAATAYFCIVEMVIAIALRAHPTYTNRSGETYVAAMAMSDRPRLERLGLTAQDGTQLSAELWRAGGNRYVILLHGYASDSSEMYEYAENYIAEGYNVLLPDLRAHGESGGAYTGMGWIDRLDLLQWIDRILQERPDAEIVLHGVSMGAAALLMCTGETLPDNVLAAVSDCAYTSAWDILCYQLEENLSLPTKLIAPGASLLTRLQAGYFWGEASALEAVRHSRTPTLFIHGSADRFVPTEMVYRLYQAASCPKRLYIADGAAHAQAAAISRQYWIEIFTFLQLVRDGQIQTA